MGKRPAPLTRAAQLALVQAQWPMENQVTVSDIRPHSNRPRTPPLGHDSGDPIPADELLPGVKQLLDAPESSQYEDCKILWSIIAIPAIGLLCLAIKIK